MLTIRRKPIDRSGVLPLLTFLLTAALSILAIFGLAIGVLVGRPPIRGSCGGLSCVGLDCATCPSRHRREQE